MAPAVKGPDVPLQEDFKILEVAATCAEEPLIQASWGALDKISHCAILFTCLHTNLYSIGVLQIVRCPLVLPKRGFRFNKD